MVHGYGADAKWFATLAEIDEVFADKVRAAGCGDCGGPLDRADYERKPRGDLGEAAEAYRRRRSFCCRREGCRHRATPPSVRFLGRKVYVAVLVVVASVIGRERTLVGRGAPRQVQGVPVRTVRRWLDFWSITFVLTTLWTETKAFVASPVDEAMLPGSLLARFGVTTEATTIMRMLRWIAPITTLSVRAQIAMPA
jgi:hypothetical protein